MGKRQKIRLLCAEGDRGALQPVLDALQARGVGVSEKADMLLAVLSERFYFAKIKDETTLSIRPEDYRNDVSLKGEFVRRVMASGLRDEEKKRVLACGFRALSGEELGI